MTLETFSHPVTLADIAAGTEDVRVVIPNDLLPEFARALDVLSIESAAGMFSLAEAEDGDIDLTGEVVAELTQRCVVTLEPVANVVREPVEVRFVRGSAIDDEALADDHHADFDIMPLEGDTIDLAPIVFETIALGLDPYPRAPGAAFEGIATDQDARRESPFAALRQLKSGSET